MLGNAGTHDRLVRELVVGTGAALAFVEYDRSPEARYPVAIEQGYAAARHIVDHPHRNRATGYPGIHIRSSSLAIPARSNSSSAA